MQKTMQHRRDEIFAITWDLDGTRTFVK